MSYPQRSPRVFPIGSLFLLQHSTVTVGARPCGNILESQGHKAQSHKEQEGLALKVARERRAPSSGAGSFAGPTGL